MAFVSESSHHFLPLNSISKMIFDKQPQFQSNVESFLDCTTPLVRSYLLPKTEIGKLNKLCRSSERDKVEYFTLGDLWLSYDEWSAYGAGVPINVDEMDEPIVQYYVPYLSAIQIFTVNSSFNGLREEVQSCRDLFSDSFSDESESEKLSRSWDGSSSEEGVYCDSENHLRANDRLGSLYFEYFERSSPYGRVPLVDKICELAERYPGLLSLRSVDLSPASWMAVAWYPIYHIPMGKQIKDLATCFLTYHTLSFSFQDMEYDDDMASIGKKKSEEEEGISLPPFGLATYKMQGGGIWSSNSRWDQERLASLSSAADSWLKQLGVQHHDFNFFSGIRHG